MPQTSISLAHEAADALFAEHEGVFGAELPIYRGHVHRVIGLVGLQRDVPSELARPLGLAAFFHDAGLWLDGGTWDYLPPSVAHATAALGEDERANAQLVTELIEEHHKLRPVTNPLVEAFRRADLTDVTNGLAPAPTVSRAAYKQLTIEYPVHGFRPMLFRAFARGLGESPLHPLPMMKL